VIRILLDSLRHGVVRVHASMTSRYRFQIKTLLAQADPLELRLAKARGQVDALTPSLLARAFAGKLVPQDPADEPGEKLLERIRADGSTHVEKEDYV